ncbi:uncharacterized protein NEMAJ01_0966 [Nematocida major]|uniref:uncharacterized protein n=1 Tax=Nematocida major TaxID=1912982 RepID=UPI0020074F33|nr:uncharacterized protein NEMAJ01_0966 [Nematocida major]KAH9386070.1 hypothetical protein NEMAJ01_0966 [Nematocida major]
MRGVERWIRTRTLMSLLFAFAAAYQPHSISCAREDVKVLKRVFFGTGKKDVLNIPVAEAIAELGSAKANMDTIYLVLLRHRYTLECTELVNSVNWAKLALDEFLEKLQEVCAYIEEEKSAARIEEELHRYMKKHVEEAGEESPRWKDRFVSLLFLDPALVYENYYKNALDANIMNKKGLPRHEISALYKECADRVASIMEVRASLLYTIEKAAVQCNTMHMYHAKLFAEAEQGPLLCSLYQEITKHVPEYFPEGFHKVLHFYNDLLASASIRKGDTSLFACFACHERPPRAERVDTFGLWQFMNNILEKASAAVWKHAEKLLCTKEISEKDRLRLTKQWARRMKKYSALETMPESMQAVRKYMDANAECPNRILDAHKHCTRKNDCARSVHSDVLGMYAKGKADFLAPLSIRDVLRHIAPKGADIDWSRLLKRAPNQVFAETCKGAQYCRLLVGKSRRTKPALAASCTEGTPPCSIHKCLVLPQKNALETAGVDYFGVLLTYRNILVGNAVCIMAGLFYADCAEVFGPASAESLYEAVEQELHTLHAFLALFAHKQVVDAVLHRRRISECFQKESAKIEKMYREKKSKKQQSTLFSESQMFAGAPPADKPIGSALEKKKAAVAEYALAYSTIEEMRQRNYSSLVPLGDKEPSALYRLLPPYTTECYYTGLIDSLRKRGQSGAYKNMALETVRYVEDFKERARGAGGCAGVNQEETSLRKYIQMKTAKKSLLPSSYVEACRAMELFYLGRAPDNYVSRAVWGSLFQFLGAVHSLGYNFAAASHYVHAKYAEATAWGPPSAHIQHPNGAGSMRARFLLERLVQHKEPDFRDINWPLIRADLKACIGELEKRCACLEKEEPEEPCALQDSASSKLQEASDNGHASRMEGQECTKKPFLLESREAVPSQKCSRKEKPKSSISPQKESSTMCTVGMCLVAILLVAGAGALYVAYT